MLYDKLVQKIKDMKDVCQRKTLKENQEEQKATDQRFKSLIEQEHCLIETLSYAKENLQFQVSDSVIDALTALHEKLIQLVGAGRVQKDAVVAAEAGLKNIQAIVQKEWKEHYKALTDAKVSILNIIEKIHTENVSKYLEKIRQAESWTTNLNKYRNLKTGLLEADELIRNMGIDQAPGIIHFLQNMNMGKATVADLDDEVLAWIRKESLEKRIRLSFSNFNGRR